MKITLLIIASLIGLTIGVQASLYLDRQSNDEGCTTDISCCQLYDDCDQDFMN